MLVTQKKITTIDDMERELAQDNARELTDLTLRKPFHPDTARAWEILQRQDAPLTDWGILWHIYHRHNDLYGVGKAQEEPIAVRYEWDGEQGREVKAYSYEAENKEFILPIVPKDYPTFDDITGRLAGYLGQAVPIDLHKYRKLMAVLYTPFSLESIDSRLFILSHFSLAEVKQAGEEWNGTGRHPDYAGYNDETRERLGLLEQP